MKGYLSQMIKRPMEAFLSSVEMLGERIQLTHTIDAIVSRVAHTLSSASGSDRLLKHIARSVADGLATGDRRTTSDEKIAGAVSPRELRPALDTPSDPKSEAANTAGNYADRDIGETSYREKGTVSTDLKDDMLKLVRYKILFVKRDYEVAFPEKEELVSDNLTDTAYTAWKVAQFVQSLNDTDIPEEWRAKKYPHDAEEGTKIRKLPDADKKYLRVFYEVLDRYPRQCLEYEERQIRVLEQIRDRLGEPQPESPAAVEIPSSGEGSPPVADLPRPPPPEGPRDKRVVKEKPQRQRRRRKTQ